MRPTHSLARSRPARRATLSKCWPGRSARSRYSESHLVRLRGSQHESVSRDGGRLNARSLLEFREHCA